MHLTPDRSSFTTMVDGDAPVVAYTAAILDVDVGPLTAYAALTGRSGDGDPAPYSFLLESAEKTASSDPDGAFRPSASTAERHARYSFVGYDPDAIIQLASGEESVERLRDTRAASFVVDGTRRSPTADGNDGVGAGQKNGTGASGQKAGAGATQEDGEGREDGDVLDALRRYLPRIDRVGFPDPDRQLLTGGLVGFLAYDAVYDLWLSTVGRDRPTDAPLPDACFVLTTTTLVFDEVADTVTLVTTPIVAPDDDPAQVYETIRAEADRVETVLANAPSPRPGGFKREGSSAGPQAAYEAAVETAKEHVLDGDIYQGVISRTRELTGEIDPLGLYAALRDVNPSPYMYLLGYDDLSIVGASPETLVSVRGDRITSNPIAGTCPRGESPVDDRRLAGEMLADAKERAEHTMLVDLARNDVRRVARPGSVRVEEFMNVLKYSHVQHIESTVTATLMPGADAFDATRATFPAGTLSGAPKIRAMEIIDDLEREPRGVYGGGVGYYAWNGDADMAIVIRTATIEHDAVPAGDRIRVRAGAGLVADSEPTREYEETERKMDGVLAALAAIETTARDATPVPPEVGEP